MRPGNLYRVLDRLIDAGLVAERPAGGQPSQGGERTRLFTLTPLGLETAAAEARLLSELIDGSEHLARSLAQARSR